MSSNARIPALFFTMMLFGPMAIVGHAEQWFGPGNPNGTIWRPGNVAVGEEPRKGDGPRAVLEVTRPLAMAGDSDDRLFSANMLYKDNTSTRFEVDTRHAYAGGARSKAGILPADLDFAVHRKAAIGVANMNERLPSDYMLVVGGKILAEEVRIKLIKDWADYVFAPDYRLKGLPDIETFIQTHHHLPDIPTAAEVEAGGVGLGEMQAKLLRKIEELTLYLIEQHKTIETLKAQLAGMQPHGPSTQTMIPLESIMAQQEPAEVARRDRP
jgi:hypothetical protein